MGGSAKGDGLDAIDTHGGNCAILSAEVIETLSPLRILETSLVAGSGGTGEHRGGLGIRRDYQFLSGRTIMGAYVQQTRPETQPWGLEGGGPGAPGSISLNPGRPNARPLKSKIYGLKLEKGDVMRFQGAGGGGWGDPKKRAAAAVARDKAEGFV